MNEQIYKIKGMHCASCEIIIEKKLLELPGIKSVDATTSRSEAVVVYEGNEPSLEKINNLFKKDNYSFSKDNSDNQMEQKPKSQKVSPSLVAFNIAIFIVIAFLFLQFLGISNFINLSSKSSLVAIFGFGLLAGISSCAALVGGIVLSMSKQWNSLYNTEDSMSKKLQPHIMFNFGRFLSYAVLGGVLGAIGSSLQISLTFMSFLIIVVSVLMIIIGFQMLGVKAFQRFQFSVPKSATKFVASEKNFKGKHMPFLMGATTFFLPCGFTITAQSIALLSGNIISGALITGVFALGTAPSLLLIGLGSVKFSERPHIAKTFSKVAGFLLLFFAFYNISNQMNVLGFTGFNFNQNQNSIVLEEDLPSIVNGKQILKMNAGARGYSPNYLKVRVGVPIRWEITDTGTSGCTNAIISKGLFDGEIRLTPGKTSIKEFVVSKAGKYRFSCWMGMVSGIIEAVDTN